ncbi:MAG: peptide chain release factor 1, partial [Chlorobi bacterium]|nr:peptide chain release factor 1 [Chlorobiota bacterium]
MIEDKFEAVKQRFRELSEELVNPAVMRDREKYARLNREYKELRQLIEK